jgi:2-(1,2-epoxy-1,2-dihydrophenyl)acetyl-CoA isomerase
MAIFVTKKILACDMIIANQEAYLTELFVGIGLMPDAGSMFFLPRIIGTHRAFELCSTGRKVFMEEAIQLGIVNKAVPYTELDAEIEKLTNYYKNAATRSIGLMKNVLNQSLNSSLDEILEQEAVGQDMLGNTHDFGEGVMSFLQKRKPQFKGK